MSDPLIPVTLPQVVQLFLDAAQDALETIVLDETTDPPLTEQPEAWIDLSAPPRFPHLLECHDSLLAGWVQPVGPKDSRRGCPGPMEWQIRLRWWLCHPSFDSKGMKIEPRDAVAQRILTAAQTVQSALAAELCGPRPFGIQAWKLEAGAAVKPAAKSAGWEFSVRVVLSGVA